MQSPLPAHLRRAFYDYLAGKQHAYATTLLSILSYLYGAEFMSSTEDGRPWAPESLRMQVKDDLGFDIDDKVMDKIQAGILAVTDDRVLEDAVIFNNVATALFDLDVLVDEWDEPEPEELAWAIYEIILLRGEDRDEAVQLAESISSDVETYIRVVLQRAGFTKPPQSLRFVELTPVSEEDYSDDPNMFASVFQEQQGKVEEVDALVQENLTKLIDQLKALGLGGEKPWLDVNRVIG